MHHPALPRRLTMLIASCVFGSLGWWLLGVAESATASRGPQTVESSFAAPSAERVVDPAVMARVDGMAITRSEVEADAAADLDRLEVERREVVEAALEARIDALLLEAEAARRGVPVTSLDGDRALLERLREAARIEGR